MPKSVLDSLKKALFCFHVGVYRLTSGRVLGKIVGAPVLLLTTTGRRTGKRITWPLLYLVEGDSYVVVASNGGSITHPSWYLNLTSYPTATIRLRSYQVLVEARTASPEERTFLWPKMVELYSGYETYQGRTKRQIPLVMLKEVGEASS